MDWSPFPSPRKVERMEELEDSDEDSSDPSHSSSEGSLPDDEPVPGLQSRSLVAGSISQEIKILGEEKLSPKSGVESDNDSEKPTTSRSRNKHQRKSRRKKTHIRRYRMWYVMLILAAVVCCVVGGMCWSDKFECSVRNGSSDDSTDATFSSTRRVQFFDRLVLTEAVDNYNSSSGLYPPINSWDVSQISDFSSLFDARRNPAMKWFNETILDWNLGRATDASFMFRGAESFNQNLCEWRDRILFVNTTDMFINSGCPNTSEPVFERTSRGVFKLTGPWCWNCEQE